jgi:hypothetical protein
MFSYNRGVHQTLRNRAKAFFEYQYLKITTYYQDNITSKSLAGGYGVPPLGDETSE